MPCYDKKLEASRSEFYNDVYRTRDVDTVLTSTEIIEILTLKDFDLMSEQFTTEQNEKMEDQLEFSDLFNSFNEKGELISGTTGGSGGYAEYIFKYAAKTLFNKEIEKIEWKKVRNVDLQEVSLEIDGKKVLNFALAYGFRNIQNIVRKIKSNTCTYHYVEVMACPSGCLNGGGQIKKNTNDREEQRNHLKEVENLYQGIEIEQPHNNPILPKIYQQFVQDKPYSILAQKLFHTTYKPIQKDNSSLNIRW